MIADNSPLCCCEYLDIHEERNHILACCCNCQDFDEGFDSFISGRGIPRHSRTGFMATLHDRLRIPWKGGAKRISIEATISIILVPIFLLVASINPVWTAMSALTMIGFLIYVRCRAYDSVHGAKFFHAWVNTSFVALYFIFEFVVIPFLEILWEENIALSVVIALSCFWFWKVKKRRVADSLSRNCLNCMTPVPNDSRHVAWLDCCIGRHNSRHYIFGLAAAVTALLYGCNLTFTTICHPFTWFATILLPDDCTEAYDLFELSLSFVSGLYCLALAIYMLILLLHQVVLTIMYNTCVSSPVDKKENDNFIA